jgi:hypothetical protein
LLNTIISLRVKEITMVMNYVLKQSLPCLMFAYSLFFADIMLLLTVLLEKKSTQLYTLETWEITISTAFVQLLSAKDNKESAFTRRTNEN